MTRTATGIRPRDPIMRACVGVILCSWLVASVAMAQTSQLAQPAQPASNLIHRADNVARGILTGLRKLVPKELVQRMAQINGTPGVVSYLNGKPFSVLTLDAIEGRVRAIYIVTNPEKLSHLPELPANPR